jgi:hypothetical protein
MSQHNGSPFRQSNIQATLRRLRSFAAKVYPTVEVTVKSGHPCVRVRLDIFARRSRDHFSVFLSTQTNAHAHVLVFYQRGRERQTLTPRRLSEIHCRELVT